MFPSVLPQHMVAMADATGVINRHSSILQLKIFSNIYTFQFFGQYIYIYIKPLAGDRWPICVRVV